MSPGRWALPKAAWAKFGDAYALHTQAQRINMNWTAILAAGNVPDSPGRIEAVQQAQALSKVRRETKGRSKSRKSKRPNRFPGLKHGAD